MRADGIIRRFDDLGRIVIPKELRKQIFGTPDKSEGMPMEIFLDKDEIILRKYEENADDDVCEWKYKHPFGDFPSCKNVNSISRDGNWKFCPYCGKKIKIVGD